MRLSRSPIREVESAMTESATANSGASAMASSAYSPIQNESAGKALRRPASSCRKPRNPVASAYAESALKLSMTMMPGLRSRISSPMRSETASRPPSLRMEPRSS